MHISSTTSNNGTASCAEQSASDLKRCVRQHWEAEVCGSRYGDDVASDRRNYFDQIDRTRYQLEPTLLEFARFEDAARKRVLEVGLGTGADFSRWVRAGAIAYGRDLTDASVELVKERLQVFGLRADVAVGDAENLSEFPEDFFDIYYSWGVLHHTASPEAALSEAYRVLKPGGELKLMLYHYPSVSAFQAWALHGPLRLRFQGPRRCVAEHYESPGTIMYTVAEARRFVGACFKNNPIEISLYVTAGDLLTLKLSRRYGGSFWKLVQALYPRWFVKHVLGSRFGTGMMISTRK